MIPENSNENTNKKSVSERTHAKNAEHLHVANTIIASIGTPYNPTNTDLLAPNRMTAFEDGFTGHLQSVNEKEAAEQMAVGAQIAAFKLVKPRVQKIIKAAKAQGLSEEFIERLQSNAYRLYGAKINKNTPDVSEGGHSVSRRSYAGILETLDEIDEQLKSNPDYAPNETELQSATITAWVEELRTIHNNALAAKTATRAARNARDEFGYNSTDGLIVRVGALKNYLETILDKTDTRLIQLKRLKFAYYRR